MSEIEVAQGEMSFIDHLEELRWHIIRSLVAILVITILTFLGKGFVFDYLIFGPKHEDFLTYKLFCQASEALGLGTSLCIEAVPFEIINVEMTGQFITHLKVAIILGFIVSFPYILYEAWKFIQPGLLASEQKYTKGVVVISSILFFIGVLFGYYVLSPFSINFFATYNVSAAVANTITLNSYISIITTLVLASGIMFELPMVVYFLSKIGILTPAYMREYRKHAFITILVVAAIITPADIWTQVLVSLPVYLLYELSIGVSASVVRRRLKEEKALQKTK